MADKPTKKWFEDQIKSCQATIMANNVIIQFCQQMIEKGIFIEEREKEGGDANPG